MIKGERILENANIPLANFVQEDRFELKSYIAYLFECMNEKLLEPAEPIKE